MAHKAMAHYEITPHLQITVDFYNPEDTESLMEATSIIDFVRENFPELSILEPEDIGALTDSPLIGLEGRVWWFPQYQIEDPLQILMEQGVVTLERA